jgi:hypothetical protein
VAGAGVFGSPGCLNDCQTGASEDSSPGHTGSEVIALTAIRTEEGCQARMAIRRSVVHAYARAMIQQQSEGGLRFPAIVLFTDGSQYWLGDGYHRVLAAHKAGLTELLAEIHSGSRREPCYMPFRPTPSMACPGPTRTSARRSRCS